MVYNMVIMREFLKQNKSVILKLLVLLLVFFLLVAYFNGRSIYQERMKQIEERTANISLI